MRERWTGKTPSETRIKASEVEWCDDNSDIECPIGGDASRRYRYVDARKRYCIGDDGSVWSKRRGQDHFTRMKTRPNHWGYPVFEITTPKGRRPMLVHRVVLTRFVRPGAKGEHGAHNNGFRNDNRIENLRWATVKENMEDKKRHGTEAFGVYVPGGKFTDEQVAAMRMHREKTGDTYKAMAAKFGISVMHVRDICVGRYRATPSHRGGTTQSWSNRDYTGGVSVDEYFAR